MSYSELVQAYFERSVALQWYWTIYLLVIGGVVAFTNLRQRPERVTSILLTVLYACFAYKNLGAVEATAGERQVILSVVRDYPTNTTDVMHARARLEAAMPDYDIAAARYFHLLCDALTVSFLWAKEWQRRHPSPSHVAEPR